MVSNEALKEDEDEFDKPGCTDCDAALDQWVFTWGTNYTIYIHQAEKLIEAAMDKQYNVWMFQLLKKMGIEHGYQNTIDSKEKNHTSEPWSVYELDLWTYLFFLCKHYHPLFQTSSLSFFRHSKQHGEIKSCTAMSKQKENECDTLDRLHKQTNLCSIWQKCLAYLHWWFHQEDYSDGPTKMDAYIQAISNGNSNQPM